jgi:hypothetical protein
MAMATFGLVVTTGCNKQDLGSEADLSTGESLKGKPVTYPLAESPTQLDVYGVWHAGNDYCTWGTVRDMTEFDQNNHWIIDRGDTIPSVNLVVLSFVNPLDLLNATGNPPLDGIPVGMTPEVVNYFKDEGIRVMLSIGGWTYIDDWNAALAADPVQLALNAAAVASTLGVGIEIDYEENTNPNITALDQFITTYRSVHSYDADGINHAARLTIDLAAGDRWLIALCQHASANWLTTGNPVLDYANAMVPARQPSAEKAKENWYEHVYGKPQYAPPIPSIAPCKFTGGLYITGRSQLNECITFNKSLQYATSDFVTRIMPHEAGSTPGMLGYMFWAAECPSTGIICATNCTGGVGEGSTYFEIPVPMPPLRQE